MAGRKDDNRKPNALKRYYDETVGELRKVSWPTRQEATNLTIIVLIVMVAMSIFLWVIDQGATQLLALAIGNGS